MTDWETIVRQHGPAVWRTARRLLGHDADADECYQDVFLGALELSRRQAIQHWRALLIKLATARALDRLRQRVRSRSRYQPAEWDQLSERGRLPREAAEDAELAQRLQAALAELPPRQSEIFCLACLDGWSYRQIADELAISVDSVGVTIHRARQKLNQLLAPTIDEVI